MANIDKNELLAKCVKKHQKDTICFLQKLLSFDSRIIDQGKMGKEKNIQAFLADRLRQLGCEVDYFEPDEARLEKYADFNPGHDYKNRPNVVGTLRGSGGGRSLILNGHVDTVDIGDPKEWRHDPFAGEIDGDLIYGRGTADMKAGVAAMITAVQCLREAEIKLKGDVIIQCVVDEEGGGNGTLACVDRGYRADAAIITEPTSLKILTCHRGAMHLTVRTFGRATHASMKWDGVNAIEKMTKIMAALSELEKDWLARKRHPLLPSPTIMFGEIRGGVGASIVPAECESKIDVKYLPYENPGTVREEVENCINRVGDEWLRENPPEINWTLNTSPYETDSRHPIVGEISEKSLEINGKVEIGGLPSGADARIINNIGKIPTVIFGPGNLKQAHSADEWVSLSEYQKSVEILAQTIAGWCG
ncbi:MAG: ArgE/DapE family deacylase [Victivallaceae bacterium]|nr:ArgE/DapE family deacylase [Victivallaceae bacterium]